MKQGSVILQVNGLLVLSKTEAEIVFLFNVWDFAKSKFTFARRDFENFTFGMQ